MKQKIILITGSTSGIGKAVAKEIARQGHQVILLSRSKEKLEETKLFIMKETRNKSIDSVQCDLSLQRSIRIAAQKIKNRFGKIDVLINNAGIHVPHLEITEEGIEKTFATNHLGYFLLTGLLIDLLKKSNQGRIINVSSNCHNKYKFNLDKILETRIYGKYPAYCRSKLANIMFTIDLSKKLEGTKITVNAVHPGLIRTNIGMDNPDFIRRLSNIYKRYFAGTAEEGALTPVYLAMSENVKNITGKYFVNKKISRYSKQADNQELRKALWNVSEELTNFTYNL